MSAVPAGLVLVLLLAAPGWALLTLGQQWRHWAPLQRWCLAVGLSLGLYPVLFYLARLIPGFTLGPLKLTGLLLACGLWTAWHLRRHWRSQFTFDRLEWLAIGLISLTLLTRLWVLRVEPFPAWSDSLHHTLLTEITAAQGRLPFTLEPYAAIPLEQYHLGLYALSGSVGMLSGAAAHTALLVTAQALNGLCGLGLYLVLDRKVGRVAALAGLVVVGLASKMPAWYVNWGRYTQLAGQALMLAAWLLTWEALSSVRRRAPAQHVLWLTGTAGLLTAATFVLHFRVAAFVMPLYVGVGLWELWRAYQAKRLPQAAATIAALGLVVVLLAGPVLVPAVGRYLRPPEAPSLSEEEVAQNQAGYFGVPLSLYPELAGPAPLLWLALAALAVGLLWRNRLALLTLGWCMALLAMGNGYLLGVPALSFTNIGAVLIMLYLPMGLAIGVAAQALVALAGGRGWPSAPTAAAILLGGGALLLAPGRATALEPYRFFVTAADVPAMQWIRTHTPADALFAVNTTFWLPGFPHGTDAGYWIPYMAHRRITVGTMLAPLGTQADHTQMVRLSEMVERLETDPAAVVDLAREGVDYIYVGARGDFSGPGLDPARLSQVAGVRVEYAQAGVTIMSLDPRLAVP